MNVPVEDFTASRALADSSSELATRRIGMCGYTAVPEDGRNCSRFFHYMRFWLGHILDASLRYRVKCPAGYWLTAVSVSGRHAPVQLQSWQSSGERRSAALDMSRRPRPVPNVCGCVSKCSPANIAIRSTSHLLIHRQLLLTMYFV